MRLVAVYLFAFLATSVSLVLAGSDNVFVGVTNSRTELTKQIEFFVHPYSSQNANDIIHQHQHSHTHEPKLHYFTHSPLVSDFEVTSGDELLVTHSKYENQQVRVQVPVSSSTKEQSELASELASFAFALRVATSLHMSLMTRTSSTTLPSVACVRMT